MSYSVITPFIVPADISTHKRVNIGDGFILDSIKKLLLPLKCEHIFSSRKALSDSDIAKVNSTKVVILAGANQLHDEFSVLPKMTVAQLHDIRVPILPFGIGLYGDERRNRCMSENTSDILREIHQRIEFSSWRCPRTVEYITQALPDLSRQFLMTGCPVMYGNREPSISSPIPIEPSNRLPAINRVVVTVTDRGDFWERELRTLNFVSQRFKAAEKILSLHQDFFVPRLDLSVTSAKNLAKFKLARQYEKTPLTLRAIAKKKGFKVFIPRSIRQCFDRYENIDLHLGSRLHAHLYFLSQRKPSFLTYVDDRCLGFAEALDFSICEPTQFESYLDYDFSRCQSRVDELEPVMKQFVNSVKEACA